MQVDHIPRPVLDDTTAEFYRRSLQQLNASGTPFLVGGGYAFSRYTGIERHTKDFDVFVLPEDCQRVLEILADNGCQTDLTFPHWLGKAFRGDDVVDVIFSSGNGEAPVDDRWFDYAVADVVLGIPVRLCPAEEMIWQKALIMERERFDGADVAHMLRARAGQLDWRRLVERFGSHWRVLLSHLVLFGFIYPAERNWVPSWVTNALLDRLALELREPPPTDQLCQGTIISREQYLVDISRWGYRDARLPPSGTMSRAAIAHWTASIADR